MFGHRRGISIHVATAATELAIIFPCHLTSAWDSTGGLRRPTSTWRPTRTIGPGGTIAAKPPVASHVSQAAEQSNPWNEEAEPAQSNEIICRRDAMRGLCDLATLGAVAVLPTSASARCTDIESCREIGDRKVDEDMKANPTTTLPSGVRYKVLRPPTGRDADVQVKSGSTVDVAFSISANGAYMYSRGFGFEKIDVDGKKQSDLGLDSLRVKIGNERRVVPLGIEQALVGMRRGERRRIELPPSVGFETSEWRPEPVTRRGKASIASYKRILEGGANQPAFPAVTYWDVEVLRIKDV